jgi:FMN phosphatase YigB (HAD superfamily)
VVKRLLGLAYFYCGAENAVEMQLWATWLLYAVLVDLTDAIAEALERPFNEVSMEMVYQDAEGYADLTARLVRFFPHGDVRETPQEREEILRDLGSQLHQSPTLRAGGVD